MKAVYHTVNPTEAALICGYLEECGIEAEVTNEDLAFAFGEIPIDPSTMPTVLVPDADAERAETLISDRSGWIDEAEWGEDKVQEITSEEEDPGA